MDKNSTYSIEVTNGLYCTALHEKLASTQLIFDDEYENADKTVGQFQNVINQNVAKAISDTNDIFDSSLSELAPKLNSWLHSLQEIWDTILVHYHPDERAYAAVPYFAGIDTAPTYNSGNPISSGAMFAALNDKSSGIILNNNTYTPQAKDGFKVTLPNLVEGNTGDFLKYITGGESMREVANNSVDITDMFRTINGLSIFGAGDLTIGGDGTPVTVDAALSTTSANPVLNRAITTELNLKYVKPAGGIPAADLASDVINKSLASLTDDVTINNVTLSDGNVLMYDSGEGKWTNTSLSDKYIEKNESTPGLLKSDGTVDENTYLTSASLSDYIKNIKVNGIDLVKSNGTVDLGNLKIENGEIIIGGNSIIPLTEITKAESNKLGGIKLGYLENGKNYKVKVDENGNAYVTVNWQPGEPGDGGKVDGVSKSDNSTGLSVSSTDGGVNVTIGFENSYGLVTDTEKTAWNSKQDAITDLSNIRQNATNGATAYGWGDHSAQGYLKSSEISAWAKGANKPDYNFSEINNKPNSLEGYGITDARIEGDVIFLGSNSITPLTEHQSLTDYIKKNSSATGFLKDDGSVYSYISVGDFEPELQDALSNIESPLQSDWNETDENSLAYIKNKPTNLGGGSVTSVGLSVPTGFTVSGSPVTTSGTLSFNFAEGMSLFSNAQNDALVAAYDARHTHANSDILNSINADKIAEWENVQADWNVTDSSSDAYIANKPNIPANFEVLNALDGAESDSQTISALWLKRFFEEDPFGDKNVQADWNVTNTASDSYIKNKPTISTTVGNNSNLVTGKAIQDYVATELGKISTADSNHVVVLLLGDGISADNEQMFTVVENESSYANTFRIADSSYENLNVVVTSDGGDITSTALVRNSNAVKAVSFSVAGYTVITVSADKMAYSITKDVKNGVIISDDLKGYVIKGEPYTAQISLKDNHTIASYSITMGGVSVNNYYNVATGVINIPSVTGNVVVSFDGAYTDATGINLKSRYNGNYVIGNFNSYDLVFNADGTPYNKMQSVNNALVYTVQDGIDPTVANNVTIQIVDPNTSAAKVQLAAAASSASSNGYSLERIVANNMLKVSVKLPSEISSYKNTLSGLSKTTVKGISNVIPMQSVVSSIAPKYYWLVVTQTSGSSTIVAKFAIIQLCNVVPMFGYTGSASLSTTQSETYDVFKKGVGGTGVWVDGYKPELSINDNNNSEVIYYGSTSGSGNSSLAVDYYNNPYKINKEDIRDWYLNTSQAANDAVIMIFNYGTFRIAAHSKYGDWTSSENLSSTAVSRFNRLSLGGSTFDEDGNPDGPILRIYGLDSDWQEC